MIQFMRGNLFDSGADILVNPVNCVGVMAKVSRWSSSDAGQRCSGSNVFKPEE